MPVANPRTRSNGRLLYKLALMALLLALANTLLAWAEETLPTGLAALIVVKTAAAVGSTETLRTGNLVVDELG